jgi:Patched family
VKDSLQTIGTSVLIGGFSTFLGVLPLFFSSSELMRTLFFAFIGMVLLGCSHGLILLPVLLLRFGPVDTSVVVKKHADSYSECSTTPVSSGSDCTTTPGSPNEQFWNGSPTMSRIRGGTEDAVETNSFVSSEVYKPSEFTNEGARTFVSGNRSEGPAAEECLGRQAVGVAALEVTTLSEETDTLKDDCILIPAELGLKSTSLDAHDPAVTLTDDARREDTSHDTPCDWLHVAQTEKTSCKNESGTVPSYDRDLQTQEESSKKLVEMPIEKSLVSSPSMIAASGQHGANNETSEIEGSGACHGIAQMARAVTAQEEIHASTPIQPQDTHNLSAVPPPGDLCGVSSEITENIDVLGTVHQQSTAECTDTTASSANRVEFAGKTPNACEGSSLQVANNSCDHDDCTATTNSTPRLEITDVGNWCNVLECLTTEIADQAAWTDLETLAVSGRNLDFVVRDGTE